MYIGNGVTKEFPLPEGKDGSLVILRMPGGKGIKMLQGESYTVEEGTVKFKAAVPSGVEVIFDELEDGEMISSSGAGYVVIYSDGTMKTVTEDPALIVESAMKLLEEAKAQSEEIKTLNSETVSYLTAILGAFRAEMDGRLSAPSIDPETIAESAFRVIKQKMQNEYIKIVNEMRLVLQSIYDSSCNLERLKAETQKEIVSAAETVKTGILEKFDYVLSGIEKLKHLKSEIEETAAKGKSEAKEIYYELSDKLSQRTQEELELLKSLRLRLENDYGILNKKINNRLELLGVMPNE